MKTLTANHTSRLNGHDTSISGLSASLESANASISALNTSLTATDNKIVIYDTSLRSDVSTLETTLTTHLTEFDTSVRNHFASLDDSDGYLRTERNRLDASIVSLTNYIDTTVTTILSEDRARINSIESLAIDTSVYVHDNITAQTQRLDASLNQFDNTQQSLISNWDERDIVIARALAQHDASILNLIARVTALENA